MRAETFSTRIERICRIDADFLKTKKLVLPEGNPLLVISAFIRVIRAHPRSIIGASGSTP